MLADSVPVVFEPLVASDPDHAPEAVHAVASVEDQVRVVLPPLETALGFAVRVTAGGEAALTVIVADRVALPPAPVHVNTYWAVALNGPVDREPLVASDPFQAPEAAHAELFVEFHTSIADWPLAIETGLGERLIVGLRTVTLEPVPAVDVVPVLTVLAFELDWTTPAPQPDNMEADASISGKYQLRFKACAYPCAVLTDSLPINASRLISR